MGRIEGIGRKPPKNSGTCLSGDMVQGTMDAADGKAAEALGLAGEGAQAGVNMAVGKRRHSGVAMLLI